MQKTVSAVPLSSMFLINERLKGFLIVILCLIPFQYLPETLLGNSGGEAVFFILRYVRYIDEFIFLFSLTILITFILLNPSGYMPIGFPFTGSIALFFVFAVISLTVNQVGVFQGFFGIYDVLKNIFVIYIFAHLGFTKGDFKRVMEILTAIAIIIAAVGIAAEILALVSGLGVGYLVTEEKRLGLHRVFSLAGSGNWNYLGIYMTLIFYLAAAIMTPSKKKWGFLIMILITIFLSFSRRGWLAFGLLACILKRRLIPIGIAAIGVSIWMLAGTHSFTPDYYFRSFAFLESLRILTDNPIFGVGPGMFGSISAGIFGTPFYGNWPSNYINFVERQRGAIDMFWPAVWAQLGIIGFLLYLSIWISIFFYIKRVEGFFSAKKDLSMQNIGKILRYFMLALGVMGFGSGLNSAMVIFTYFALVGMYISAYRMSEEDNEDTSRK